MLSPKLLEILREWWRVSRPRHWLFPGEHPNEPITTHSVNCACQTAHRRSGIPKPITPHSLRHAGMSMWLRKGVDLKLIQTWGGWHSLKVMLDTYAALLPGAEEDSIALLEGRKEFPSHRQLPKRF